MKQITVEKIEEVELFLQREILRYQSLWIRRENILILMPSWFQQALVANIHRTVRENYISGTQEGFSSGQSSTIFNCFMGIKIQDHYKDEVVVFLRDYDKFVEEEQNKIFLL